MYEPIHFEENRPEFLHALIREHPLGLLVCNGKDGPLANPVPFLLDIGADGGRTLRTHLAKANPQWQALRDNPETPVLVVFQGPQAYISPSWYATKAETGKVVPTWNYIIVQARGIAMVHPEPEWLARQVAALTETQESSRAAPWNVSDAPGEFVAMQLRAIVGVEIAISEIRGKWKVSQNRPSADRSGVANGLEESGRGTEAASMAEWVRRGGGKT